MTWVKSLSIWPVQVSLSAKSSLRYYCLLSSWPFSLTFLGRDGSDRENYFLCVVSATGNYLNYFTRDVYLIFWITVGFQLNLNPLPQPKLLSYELLDLVSSHFNLKEKEFFGLAFFDDKYVNCQVYFLFFSGLIIYRCPYMCVCSCVQNAAFWCFSLFAFAVVSVSGCRWTAEFLNMTFQRSPGPLPSTSWSGNNSFFSCRSQALQQGALLLWHGV